MPDSEPTITARRAALAEIFQLRRDVLRAGLPEDAARFAGDDAPDTIHVGAFTSPDNRNVCCATGNLNEWEGQPAWQLRGMAVAPDLQRRGVGQLTLAKLVELARAARPDVRCFWCNARVPAIPFYERQGWRVVSEEFAVPTAGPHVKMVTAI
jgi:GNAT superfamily N-acetyltransferase